MTSVLERPAAHSNDRITNAWIQQHSGDAGTVTGHEGRLPRLLGWTSVAVVTALSLGLVGPAQARAGCVGPHLVVVEAGATATPRPDLARMPEDVVLTTSAGEPLTVVGSYLTMECDDTPGTTVGCSGESDEDGNRVFPLQDTRLTLVQGERTWQLGTFGDIGADLSAVVDVRLPDDIRIGRARLLLSEGSADPVSSVTLGIQ